MAKNENKLSKRELNQVKKLLDNQITFKDFPVLLRDRINKFKENKELVVGKLTLDIINFL